MRSRFLALALATLLAANAMAEDWPVYRGGFDRRGYLAAEGAPAPKGPLKVAWKVFVGQRIWYTTPPIVFSERVFVVDMSGAVRAFAQADGKPLWTVQTGGPILADPAIVEGKLLIASSDGKLYCLDPATGQQRWAFTSGGRIISSPTVCKGIVSVGCYDHNIYGVDLATGSEKWRVEAGGRVMTTASASSDLVYYGSEDMNYYAIDAAGSVVWKQRIPGVSLANRYSLYTNGTLIVSSVRPKKSKEESFVGPNLFFLDATTGKPKFDFPYNLPYLGQDVPVVDAEGIAYVPVLAKQSSWDGMALLAVDVKAGKTEQVSVKEFMGRGDEYGPAVLAGNLLCTTADSDLACFDVVTKKKTVLFGAWYTHPAPEDRQPEWPEEWKAGVARCMIFRWAEGPYGGGAGAATLTPGNKRFYFTAYGWLYAMDR